MQVHYDEGVANHIGPEPCAGIREDVGEASAGERAGQPLSRDRKLIPGADTVCVVEGNMPKSANASTWTTRLGRRTWYACMFLARNRETPRPTTGTLPIWSVRDFFCLKSVLMAHVSRSALHHRNQRSGPPNPLTSLTPLAQKLQLSTGNDARSHLINFNGTLCAPAHLNRRGRTNASCHIL